MLTRTSCAIFLAFAAGAYAQPPGRGPGGMGRFEGGPGGPPPDVRLIGAAAGMLRHVVKNAPYSADIVTETTQILADGNHIRQTSSAKIYRDAEGRVRNEQTPRLGALAPNSGLSPVIFINDPVAGVNYALNARDKTFTKSTANRPGNPPDQGIAGRGMGGRRGAEGPAGGRFGRGQDVGQRPNVKTESLGRQTMEGVPVDGTRTTETIAAGQIGNDLPLQIVWESWYSPDLQTVVFSKHSDPRGGETVFRLTNVSRNAPAPSLFQPPADYKVVDSAGAGREPLRQRK